MALSPRWPYDMDYENDHSPNGMIGMRERIAALELGGGGGDYDDSAVLARLDALEAIEPYDDTALAEALAALEAQVKWDGVQAVGPGDYTNSTIVASDVVAGFAPDANGLYMFEFVGAGFAAVGTTGLQAGMNGPTGMTWFAQRIDPVSNTQAVVPVALNAYGLNTIGTTHTATVPWRINGMCLMGGSPGAGNLRPTVASEVAASAVTLKAGSFFRWKKLN